MAFTTNNDANSGNLFNGLPLTQGISNLGQFLGLAPKQPDLVNGIPRAQGVGAIAQSLGLAPSDEQTAAALNQLHDPDSANYSLGGDKGAGLSADYNAGINGTAGLLGGNKTEQNSAIDLARGLADGSNTGASVARAQMNNAIAQGNANLSSQSAGMGTANQGGLGARNLLQAQAAMQAQAAGQGAIAGAAEQSGNIRNYGNLVSNARNQDINQYYTGVNGLRDTQTTQLGANMNYDASLSNAGRDRYAGLTGHNLGSSAGGGKVLDTGLKVLGAGLSGGASALLPEE